MERHTDFYRPGNNTLTAMRYQAVSLSDPTLVQWASQCRGSCGERMQDEGIDTTDY